jgi:hypothetical protein
MPSSVKQKSNACIDEVRSLRRCLKTYSECVKSGGKVSECLRSEGSPQECAVREISPNFCFRLEIVFDRSFVFIATHKQKYVSALSICRRSQLNMRSRIRGPMGHRAKG